jgi:hypothetical protein
MRNLIAAAALTLAASSPAFAQYGHPYNPGYPPPPYRHVYHRPPHYYCGPWRPGYWGWMRRGGWWWDTVIIGDRSVYGPYASA